MLAKKAGDLRMLFHIHDKLDGHFIQAIKASSMEEVIRELDKRTLPEFKGRFEVRYSPKCECGRVLNEINSTCVLGVCDNCLADDAADWNYSYENSHSGPF